MTSSGGRQKRRREKPQNPELIQAAKDRRILRLWLGGAALLILAVYLLAVSCSKAVAASESGVVKSLARRTRLAESSVIETVYYTDNLNRLGKNNTTILNGLKFFYQETGVQPYLYLTNNVGLTDAAVSQENLDLYAQQLYRTLFKDEGHLLLVIFRNELSEPGELLSCVTGTAAATVMDEEAISILLQYYEAAREGNDTSAYSDRQLAEVFRNTANNIMSVRNRTGWVVVLILTVLVFLVIIAADFRKAWQKREQEEAREKAVHESFMNNPEKT